MLDSLLKLILCFKEVTIFATAMKNILQIFFVINEKRGDSATEKITNLPQKVPKGNKKGKNPKILPQILVHHSKPK